MENNKKIIIFFGPPGSGKGTQAEKLGEKIRLPVISPGNLFRHEQSENTPLGRTITGYMAKGELVPDGITGRIMDKRLVSKDAGKGFILDGYPRKTSQLKALVKFFSRILKETDKVIAVYIGTSDKAVVERIGGRRICDCGASYHVKFNPPRKSGVCDDCGKKLRRRKDDAPEIIGKRLKDFHKRIKPLLSYFEKNYFLITVDGDKNIKEVEKEIWRKLVKLI